MALSSICGTLKAGQDLSCIAPLRRYAQQAVVINWNSIDRETVEITAPTGVGDVCAYNVEFSLKEGEAGYFFIGSENGSTYKGFFAKAQSDLGFAQYTHSVQMLMGGVSEAIKCALDAMGKGRFVVALQFADGTVEIYGMEAGLTAGDYTYDVQEGGGGTAIILASTETSPEPRLPLVYKSGTPGGETADFDSAFANTGS